MRGEQFASLDPKPLKSLPVTLRVFLLVSAASVSGAILWRVMRWPPGNVGLFAGAAMILSGALVVGAPLARAAGTGRTIVAAIGAATIGVTGELVGLYYGPFGDYIYTDYWQPAITLPSGHTFPLLVPLIWHFLLAVCYAFARQRISVPAFAVGAAAVLATSVDLVAEPVFTQVVGFWIWLEPTPLLGAPYLNAVGWLVNSLVGCAWVAFVTRGRVPTGVEPTWILVATVLGIAIIGATHGEPRGLWSLVLIGPLLAWRPRATP